VLARERVDRSLLGRNVVAGMGCDNNEKGYLKRKRRRINNDIRKQRKIIANEKKMVGSAAVSNNILRNERQLVRCGKNGSFKIQPTLEDYHTQAHRS